MGSRRRDRKDTLQKNNSIEDLVGNDENGYSVPDLNRRIINVTNEPRDANLKPLREEIMEETTEKLMEKALHMVNQKV
jgi:hypothetical protein